MAYPDYIIVSNSSNIYQYFVAIITSTPSQYRVRLHLSGPSSLDYQIKYPSVNIITIFNSNQPPPVPAVTSALYSEDATYISLHFDSDTNKGGLINLVPCSRFVNFTGVSKSSCQWIDASTINIYPSPLYLFPSKLNIIPNNITAMCSKNQTKCNLWTSVSPVTVAVTLPTNPLKPSVVISAPHFLGKCSSLTIDLSNSVGSARRPWKSVHFDISIGGVSDNSSELYFFLNGDKFSISPPTTIHYSLFDGTFYNITVTLCNFMNLCGKKMHMLTIGDKAQSIPTLSILGGTVRSIKPRDILIINTMAYIDSCSSRIYSNIFYNWTALEFNSVSIIRSIRSSAQNPSSFVLSPFSLLPQSIYRIILLVTNTLSLGFTSATIVVTVEHGSLVAVITGGSIKQVQVLSNFTIDASKSYDEDSPIRAVSYKTLSFSWSMIQIQPSYDISCPLTVFDGKATISMNAASTSLDKVCRLTVTVSDSNSKRVSSTFTDVSIIANKVSQLSISLPANQSMQTLILCRIFY